MIKFVTHAYSRVTWPRPRPSQVHRPLATSDYLWLCCALTPTRVVPHPVTLCFQRERSSVPSNTIRTRFWALDSFLTYPCCAGKQLSRGPLVGTTNYRRPVVGCTAATAGILHGRAAMLSFIPISSRQWYPSLSLGLPFIWCVMLLGLTVFRSRARASLTNFFWCDLGSSRACNYCRHICHMKNTLTKRALVSRNLSRRSMSCYLREEGHPRLPYLQLPPRTLETQEAGLDGLGVDKWGLAPTRFMAHWHIHQIVRLSMVPYYFKVVYHLVIAEKLAKSRR